MPSGGAMYRETPMPCPWAYSGSFGGCF